MLGLKSSKLIIADKSPSFKASEAPKVKFFGRLSSKEAEVAKSTFFQKIWWNVISQVSLKSAKVLQNNFENVILLRWTKFYEKLKFTNFLVRFVIYNLLKSIR